MKILPTLATASILLLTGCTGDEPSPTAPPTPDTRLGVAGSACDLPVSFEVADRWGAKAINLDKVSDPNLAAMFRTGTFETICSATGEPAGTDGFLRVYLSKVGTDSPRDTLETFVAYNAEGALTTEDYDLRETEYTDITLDGKPAAEVTWNRYNNNRKEMSRFSAFALDTPQGTIVVELVPFKAGDHAALLPVYDLAKKTLTVHP